MDKWDFLNRIVEIYQNPIRTYNHKTDKNEIICVLCGEWCIDGETLLEHDPLCPGIYATNWLEDLE